MNRLQAFIQTKPFVTRKEFEEQNKVFKSEIIEDFESNMKSNNPNFVDKLCQHLKKNYEIVFTENEDKRDQYMEERRDICSEEFMAALNSELQNKSFVEPETLDKLSDNYKRKAYDSFKQSYGGEDERLFKERLFEVSRNFV